MSKCEHNKDKYYCKECGGKGICQHGKYKHNCIECGGSGDVRTEKENQGVWNVMELNYVNII